MPAVSPLLGSTGSTTFVLAAILVGCGLAMIVACLWLLRATRTDTRALGPLEVMGDRRFARRDAEARDAALAAARPEGAAGPAPMVPIDDDEAPSVDPPAIEQPVPVADDVAVEDVAVDDTTRADPDPDAPTADDTDTEHDDTEHGDTEHDDSVDAAPRAN